MTAGLEQRVGDLERRVAELEARGGASSRVRVDPVADSRLLSAIAATFGGAVFSTVDLQASRSPELRAALGGATGRAAGAWLKRLRGRPTAGYVVRREGRDDHGAVWALAVSGVTHTTPSAARGRGADSGT